LRFPGCGFRRGRPEIPGFGFAFRLVFHRLELNEALLDDGISGIDLERRSQRFVASVRSPPAHHVPGLNEQADAFGAKRGGPFDNFGIQRSVTRGFFVSCKRFIEAIRCDCFYRLVRETSAHVWDRGARHWLGEERNRVLAQGAGRQGRATRAKPCLCEWCAMSIN